MNGASAQPTCLAYVGLGANLGQMQATLRAALRSLADLPRTTLAAHSSLYRSAPVDADGADYLNAVAALQTRLSPRVLLRHLQDLEQRFGRQRPFRNAPRTLDLDVILYGDLVLETPALTLPHPRAHERAFVLVPLAQIAPALVWPGRGPLCALLAPVAGQRIERLDG